jgi:hypothetical protein
MTDHIPPSFTLSSKAMRLKSNRERHTVAPTYPVVDLPVEVRKLFGRHDHHTFLPSYWSLTDAVRVLVTRNGDVQLGYGSVPSRGDGEILTWTPVNLCQLCGVTTGMKHTTPLGVVCDWLADNGHEDSPVHRLLMFARDNPVPFEDDTSDQ